MVPRFPAPINHETGGGIRLTRPAPFLLFFIFWVVASWKLFSARTCVRVRVLESFSSSSYHFSPVEKGNGGLCTRTASAMPRVIPGVPDFSAITT